MARKFFYACAGIFLLALSYHFGAQSASAQAPGNPVVGVSHDAGAGLWAITANGDTYDSINGHGWQKLDNVFSGPTPAQQESFGSLKAKFRR